jgi:hypothetical protein
MNRNVILERREGAHKKQLHPHGAIIVAAARA